MKKLVTVMWSTTLLVELPDDATLDSLDSVDADVKLLHKIKTEGFSQISDRDGEITDVQDNY